MGWHPPSDEYIGRPPEGVRAAEVHEVGLFVARGAARRSARAATNFGEWQ